MIVTLSQVLVGARSDAILGINDRAKIIDTINRGIELACFKCNYNPWLASMDICSDDCGFVTLPTVVGTVLQVNVCGYPTTFRNDWYEWHVNGFGSNCGSICGFSTDAFFSPVFRDLREWSMIAAICEDPIDGNGSLKMVVQGETVDANSNPKFAVTIPATGASMRGVQIPLMLNWASTDPSFTYFRKITQVTKPVTRGYVKLIGCPTRTMGQAVTLGYYGPNETNPTYRRIRVTARCVPVRIRFRRATLALVDDWDIVPIGSYQAMLDLLKSIRLSDSNNPDAAEVYLQRAVRLLDEVQSIESGSTYSPMQVDPAFGVGTISVW